MFHDSRGGARYYPAFEQALMVQPLRSKPDARELLFCRCGDCGQYYVSEIVDGKTKEGKPIHIESFIAVRSEEEALKVAKMYPAFIQVIRSLQQPSFFIHQRSHVGVNRFNKQTQQYNLTVEPIEKKDYNTLPELDVFTMAQRDGIDVLKHYPGMAMWVFGKDGFIQKYANEGINLTSATHMILHLLDLFVDDELRNQINEQNISEWIDYLQQFAHGLMLRKESDRFTIYAKKVPLDERIVMTIKP